MITGSRESLDSQLKYTLLTGSTGLVGQYLLRDLLLAGERVAVLVRPTKRRSAIQRIETIMRRWERKCSRSLPRPVVISGCLTAANCGLTHDDVNWISQHCRRVMHNAAVLQFQGADRAREPWVTNVGGTQNVLNLCRETSISDLHYVSTAYVCGEQDGVIMEGQLDVGQSFRNDYEQSKFEAEVHVHDCGWIDRPTVYRPAVIAGDSQTGYTSTYHGLYLYLRLIAMLVPRVPADEHGIRHTPIRLPMSGNEPRNVVPVDWVSAVIARISSQVESRGETFHLAPDVPLTPRQVVEYCYTYFQSEGVIYCADDPAPDGEASEFEREFLRNIKLYQSYDRSDPVFDRTNLLRLSGEIPCPVIDETTLHRYLDYGQRDCWGKRRRKAHQLAEPQDPSTHTFFDTHKPGTSNATNDWLTVTTGDPTYGLPPFEIGLNIRGPGGGQWRLTSYGDQKMEIQPGLPLNPAAPILHISLSELTGQIDDLDRTAAKYFQNVDFENHPRWCGQLLSDLQRSLSASN